MEEEKQEIMLINEENIKEKIYVIRGQKVMLDFELAELYGYTTMRFNEQIKNNIEKFDEDFMFQLTKDEFDNLISKKSISSWGGRRKCPKVFTEQGIYMLMMVLKGEVATKQSKALIRTFKQMKDYIISNQNLIGEREFLQLSMQIADTIRETRELRYDLDEIEEQMAATMERLSDVVTHSELAKVMNEFGEPHMKRGYLILNGQPFKADKAYHEIYSQAKCSIYVVDNYIGLKTLEQLSGITQKIEIRIFSDNLAKGISKAILEDFRKEYPHLQIQLLKSGGVFHDRYIILDYGTVCEKIYHCGASSKDAGARVTSILEDVDRAKYKPLIDRLLQNETIFPTASISETGGTSVNKRVAVDEKVSYTKESNYTTWQQDLFEDMSVRELSKVAMENVQK